jgi:hypothetical protein
MKDQLNGVFRHEAEMRTGRKLKGKASTFRLSPNKSLFHQSATRAETIPPRFDQAHRS